MMEETIFLPTLSSMKHGNVWTGSRGNTRWRIEPSEEILRAEVWRGSMCRERSEVEAEGEFPLSQEGIEQLRLWLTQQSER